MSVWGSEWGKHQSVKIFASELEGEGNFLCWLNCDKRTGWGNCNIKLINVWQTECGIWYCALWCVSEMQVLKWYCAKWQLSEFQSEVNIILYSECVYGSVWAKFYCVHWWVSEVHGEEYFNVYSDVYQRNNLMETLQCSLMYVCGTG